MLKSHKSDIIERIRSDLDKYQVVVACSINAVQANTMNSIRRQCFAQDNKIVVTKHSLFKIAAEQSPFVEIKDRIVGESMAMVYGYNILDMVKLLSKIAKTEENWNLKFGFVIPNQYLTTKELEAIAKLPSLDTLRAQLIGRIQGVMQKILFITKAPMQKIVFLLKNKSDK